MDSKPRIPNRKSQLQGRLVSILVLLGAGRPHFQCFDKLVNNERQGDFFNLFVELNSKCKYMYKMISPISYSVGQLSLSF